MATNVSKFVIARNLAVMVRLVIVTAEDVKMNGQETVAMVLTND